jgi:hypothetical protein
MGKPGIIRYCNSQTSSDKQDSDSALPEDSENSEKYIKDHSSPHHSYPTQSIKTHNDLVKSSIENKS